MSGRHTIGDWVIEVCHDGIFMTHAIGYENEAKAKAAAARAFKSQLFTRRVRAVFEGDPPQIHEATIRPGQRTRWNRIK